MQQLKPSWDKSCEQSLSRSWQVTRLAWIAAADAGRDAIEERWHDKLDRLYMNTAMPESTYSKFLRLADKLFIH